MPCFLNNGEFRQELRQRSQTYFALGDTLQFVKVISPTNREKK